MDHKRRAGVAAILSVAALLCVTLLNEPAAESVLEARFGAHEEAERQFEDLESTSTKSCSPITQCQAADGSCRFLSPQGPFLDFDQVSCTDRNPQEEEKAETSAQMDSSAVEGIVDSMIKRPEPSQPKALSAAKTKAHSKKVAAPKKAAALKKTAPPKKAAASKPTKAAALKKKPLKVAAKTAQLTATSKKQKSTYWPDPAFEGPENAGDTRLSPDPPAVKDSDFPQGKDPIFKKDLGADGKPTPAPAPAPKESAKVRAMSDLYYHHGGHGTSAMEDAAEEKAEETGTASTNTRWFDSHGNAPTSEASSSTPKAKETSHASSWLPKGQQYADPVFGRLPDPAFGKKPDLDFTKAFVKDHEAIISNAAHDAGVSALTSKPGVGYIGSKFDGNAFSEKIRSS